MVHSRAGTAVYHGALPWTRPKENENLTLNSGILAWDTKTECIVGDRSLSALVRALTDFLNILSWKIIIILAALCSNSLLFIFSLWNVLTYGNLLLSLCLVDIMFIIDILINFRTTYVNDQEESRVNNWPSYYLQLSKQRRHFSKKVNLPNDNAGNSWILRLKSILSLYAHKSR